MATFKEDNLRFVVFLDIMGFKDRVARNSVEELYEDLSNFNQSITNIVNEDKKRILKRNNKQEDSSIGEIVKDGEYDCISVAQFSDSIVLFSKDNSLESLTAISEAAGKILKKAIEREKPIPLKGAIAEGFVIYDIQKQLFFGQALIDAYLMEESLQYYGIAVHHSAEESIIKLKSNLFWNVKIPLKSGYIEHYEIVWYKDNFESILSGLDKIRLTVSDAPRKYIDNTKNVISQYMNDN